MKCSKCAAPAASINGLTVTTCKCAAPIVAEVKAKMEGHGGFKR